MDEEMKAINLYIEKLANDRHGHVVAMDLINARINEAVTMIDLYTRYDDEYIKYEDAYQKLVKNSVKVPGSQMDQENARKMQEILRKMTSADMDWYNYCKRNNYLESWRELLKEFIKLKKKYQ